MLRAENVSYFPLASRTAILKEVNLHLMPGELVLVTGPSGSGKTTLLEVLSGLARPTRGRVLWQEKPLLAERLRDHVGLVFQFPDRYFCGRTVREEVLFGRGSEHALQVSEVLNLVGLGDIDRQSPPGALSGGQQRRLALAVQLLRRPEILLLDEPTAGLDWSAVRQVYQLLSQFKKQWGLLVVTHDPHELSGLADRVYRLETGRLLAAQPDLAL